MHNTHKIESADSYSLMNFLTGAVNRMPFFFGGIPSRQRWRALNFCVYGGFLFRGPVLFLGVAFGRERQLNIARFLVGVYEAMIQAGPVLKGGNA